MNDKFVDNGFLRALDKQSRNGFLYTVGSFLVLGVWLTLVHLSYMGV